MTLELQKYLRGHSDVEARLAELEATTGVFHKRHGGYPNLVLFKYNQIASPMGERIVQECRGIILDQDNDWSIVSRTYDKFFNYGEGHAAEIDWSTARVLEKLDGSLCQVYYYNGGWNVASSGTPDASGNVNNSDQTFAEYFWETYNSYDFSLPDSAKDYCFAFELMGPLNRVVVVHPEPKLCLIGARNMRTQQEISVEEAADLFHEPKLPRGLVPIVQSFGLQSYQDLATSFETMSPLSQEGYIVVDGNFNRVKVKHPGYVALHHAKDGLNGPKAFVEIARKGEICEVISVFPEFEPLLNSAQEKVTSFVDQLQAEYEAIKHIPEQKAFALEAQKTRCSSAMFSMRQGKMKVTVGTERHEFPLTHARDYVAHIRIDTLMDYLGY